MNLKQQVKRTIKTYQVIKTFASYQFHDRMIDKCKYFCKAGNFKAARNFKIMRLTTTNKFQAMVWLAAIENCKYLNEFVVQKLNKNNRFIYLIQVFNCIGSISEFRRKFENPILRGRDADASDDTKKKGEEKLAEVSKMLKRLILAALVLS